VKKVLIFLAVVMVIGAVIFSGCAQPVAPSPAPAPSPTPSPAPSGPTEILIGGADSQTGWMAGFGLGGLFGIQKAIEDKNKEGGIYIKEAGKKIPIRYIATNIESDASKAGSIAENLIVSDKVNFMSVGIGNCVLAAPVCAVCEKYKIPFVSATGPMEQWLGMREQMGPWDYSWAISFAVATPAPAGSMWDQPGYTMADMSGRWLASLTKEPYKTNGKVALYATDEPDGRGWFELLPSVIEGAGCTVVGKEERLGLFLPGTTDFSSIIKKWKDAGCEILAGNAPDVDTGALLRQCQAQGFKPKAAWCARAAIFYSSVNAWGGNLPQGICTDCWWSPDLDPAACPGIGSTTPKSLAQSWIDEKNEALNVGVGLGYMGGQVLLAGIEAAGTLDGTAAAEAMREFYPNNTIPTILSPARASANDSPEKQFTRYPMFLSQWREANVPEKWVCPTVFAPLPYMAKEVPLVFPIWQ
jgi:branched-chain amino acid transport system substrate-binding protein